MILTSHLMIQLLHWATTGRITPSKLLVSSEDKTLTDLTYKEKAASQFCTRMYNTVNSSCNQVWKVNSRDSSMTERPTGDRKVVGSFPGSSRERISSPQWTFRADSESYFSTCSTPTLPRQLAEDPSYSAKSARERLQLKHTCIPCMWLQIKL